MNEARLKELGVPDAAIQAVLNEWTKINGALQQENESYKTRIKDHEKSLKELEKFKGDNAQLATKLEELQNAHTAAQEKFTKDMSDYKKSQAIKYALGTMKDAKPHDTDIVMALLDSNKIDVDDNGNIKSGFDEQINTLRKDKSFLFSEQVARRGTTPPAGSSTPDTKQAEPSSLGARIAARVFGS